MTENVQLAALGLAGTAFASLMTYLTVRINRTADKVDKVAATGEATHKLVNSQHMILLRNSVADKEMLFEALKTPAAERALTEARRTLAQAEEKQRQVDISYSPGVEPAVATSEKQ